MTTTSHLSLPKENIHILLLEGIHQSAVSLLKEAGYKNITHMKEALEGKALEEALDGTHIIGVRSRTQLTKEVINKANRLMGIGCFCIGTNQVDLEAAKLKGIPVFNAPYSNTRSVAELVMGEIVMLMRRIFPRSVAAHEGTWLKSAHQSYEVRGKTLGIVGYGSIGTQLSVLAEAFGMNVIYYDVVDKLGLGNAQSIETLEELLQQSDVVSLHVPQLPSTKNLMNAQRIRMMKKGAILINNARGNVVDLEALATALKKGDLLGAAIDVFPKEPKKAGEKLSSPMMSLENVILSPHIGGSTVEAQGRIGLEVARKFVDYSDVGSTLGAVNFPEVQLPLTPQGTRFIHVHKNIPGMIAQINQIFVNEACNVTAQFLQTDNDIGYVVIDAVTQGRHEVDHRILEKLRQLDGTVRSRLIYKQN